MSKFSLRVFPLVLLGAVACSTQNANQTTTTPDGGKGMLSSSVETEKGRDESYIVQARATVTDIDYKTRLVTLLTHDGRTVTLTAGPEVKRLNEIKKGDTVLAEYYATLSFEVREPTKEEREQPTTVLSVTEKAPKTEAPGIATARGVHTIVTVTSIDRNAKTVTVKDPAGKTATVKAQNEERFAKMKVGDTVAVTFTEAMGLSIEKQ